MKKLLLSTIIALGLATSVSAEANKAYTEDFKFSFEGPFGAFDQYQLQRGLQVFTAVCSACHGLNQVAFRNLGDEGGPHLDEETVKAYALNFDVYDKDLDDTRAAKPSDKFPGSSLENAPDLSLMAKARAGFKGPYGTGINQFVKGIGGPEYIASILNGYTGEEKEEAGTTFYENTAFSTGWIAMAPPLFGEDVEFADGAKNDVRNMAQDVAAFLMWTAEPKMMARQRLGFLSVAMLSLLAVLLYLTNKKLWRDVKRKG